jgi:hypothetical protein
MPLLIATDGPAGIQIAYYTAEADHPEAAAAVAVLSFESLAHRFGFPNDETLSGHPLFSATRSSGFAFEVLYSSWIEALREIELRSFPNATGFLRDCHHYVLLFHDSMFECIARGFEEAEAGSMSEALALMSNRVDIA